MTDSSERLDYLYLTTSGWKTGKRHEIEIWFTELNDHYYVIAEHYRKAHWVQNISRDSRVSFRLGPRVFQGTARVVDGAGDGELRERVAALSRTKYGWGEGLVVELTPVSDPASPGSEGRKK
ncbi:MAG: nitroreductase/quinone reductase family protein [Acidobacteriota bacterium]